MQIWLAAQGIRITRDGPVMSAIARTNGAAANTRALRTITPGGTVDTLKTEAFRLLSST